LGRPSILLWPSHGRVRFQLQPSSWARNTRQWRATFRRWKRAERPSLSQEQHRLRTDAGERLIARAEAIESAHVSMDHFVPSPNAGRAETILSATRAFNSEFPPPPVGISANIPNHCNIVALHLHDIRQISRPHRSPELSMRRRRSSLLQLCTKTVGRYLRRPSRCQRVISALDQSGPMLPLSPGRKSSG
jgi:hypothetical protein